MKKLLDLCASFLFHDLQFFLMLKVITKTTLHYKTKFPLENKTWFKFKWIHFYLNLIYKFEYFTIAKVSNHKKDESQLN